MTDRLHDALAAIADHRARAARQRAAAAQPCARPYRNREGYRVVS